MQKEECDSPGKIAHNLVSMPQDNNPNSNGTKANMWRRPIEESSAFKFVDSSVAQRLKHGARLMKDSGHGVDLEHLSAKGEDKDMSLKQKIKVRTSTMEEPNHRYCKISISMRQTVHGHVQRLVGLLFVFARFEVSEDDFIAALKDKVVGVTVDVPGLHPYNINHLPSNFIVLIEPALTRYENKMKLKLCRYGKTNTNISDSIISVHLDNFNVVLSLV